MPVNSKGTYMYTETDTDAKASDMLNRKATQEAAIPWVALPPPGTGTARYRVVAGICYLQISSTVSPALAPSKTVALATLPVGVRPTVIDQALASISSGAACSSAIATIGGAVNIRNDSAVNLTAATVTGSWPV